MSADTTHLTAVPLFERLHDQRIRPFTAPNGAAVSQLAEWQRGLRRHLVERLGIDPDPGGRAPAAVVVDDAQLPDHRRIRIELTAQSGLTVPVWLLVPDGRSGPGPAVVAVHGHGSGVNEIVGLTPRGDHRTDPAGYQHDFALRLVRRGFVVAAPEMLGFGARREPADAARGVEESSCRTLATWTLMLGTTLIGLRAAELMQVVDLVSAHPDVDPGAIGIFGISGGATASMFTAVLDTRLASVVLSGYVSSFRTSVLAMEHCICNVIPGIAADLEMEDLALGIAPRPLLLEAGRSDGIFPIAAVRDAAGRIRRGYRDAGAEDRFELDEFEGEHEVAAGRSIDFLDEWLRTATTRAT